MNRLCLDTSAYSNFQRGHRETVDYIDQADWIGLPEIVRGELWAGFLLGNQVERNVNALARFLDHAAVESLVVNGNVAFIYGEIFGDLRRKGTPLPSNDIWIAATAIHAGATVLTFDSHFREIARVGVVVLDASTA